MGPNQPTNMALGAEIEFSSGDFKALDFWFSIAEAFQGETGYVYFTAVPHSPFITHWTNLSSSPGPALHAVCSQADHSLFPSSQDHHGKPLRYAYLSPWHRVNTREHLLHGLQNRRELAFQSQKGQLLHVTLDKSLFLAE